MEQDWFRSPAAKRRMSESPALSPTLRFANLTSNRFVKIPGHSFAASLLPLRFAIGMYGRLRSPR
jgi:hypothetical protein